MDLQKRYIKLVAEDSFPLWNPTSFSISEIPALVFYLDYYELYYSDDGDLRSQHFIGNRDILVILWQEVWALA